MGVAGQWLTFTARGSTLDVRIWRLRPILTSKVDPRTERVNKIMVVVDP